MKATGPRNNSCALSFGDVQWIYNNINRPTLDVVKGLVARRYQNVSPILTSDKTVIEFIQGCTRSCENEFKSSELDNKRYMRFCAYDSEKSKLEDVLSTFQLLWRGFSKKDITNTVTDLESDKAKCEQEIAICLKENGIERAKISVVLNDRKKNRSGLEKRKKRKKRPGKKWILEKKLALLKQDQRSILEIRKDLNDSFQLPKEEIASSKLLSETRRRRFKIPPFWFEGDFLSIRARLYFLHEEHLSFPLRFMENMPTGLYHKLIALWAKGMSKDDIVLTYRDYCEKHSSSTYNVNERLFKNYSLVMPLCYVDRTRTLEEISICDEKEAYLAQALLCATLLEGLIWDFAECLNRRHYRIFKPTGYKWPRGYAYKWDESTGKVVLKSGKGNVDLNTPIFTGRDVLGKTRLGYYLPKTLCMYIISDFFDDRNCYAHANNVNRNIKADATSMLLCLDYLVERFKFILVDKKGLVCDTDW